ncbi:glutathione S-transferase T1-like [Tripterygium wilfordii]|uniref:glutathione S-transferase T1-like n=1 Tax=Tripterygium wilfordii TaxID=458696 RepID=UPI0018F845D7|nr:glutathione S-transferase T1-like [Tripterygium wilfordii]
MTLQVYGHRLSQPFRAVILFCKVNGIKYEEITVDLTKHQQKSPAYIAEINPMGQVPAIADGTFKLFESHAILTYLAIVNPEVADHCSIAVVLQTKLAPLIGQPLNPAAAAKAEKLLISALSKVESIWLDGNNGGFLLGNDQPSIADLSLVCEIMELEVLDDEHRNRILGPYKKVQKWIDNTRNATSPYFHEVHQLLFQIKESMQNNQSEDASDSKKDLYSKM